MRDAVAACTEHSEAAGPKNGGSSRVVTRSPAWQFRSAANGPAALAALLPHLGFAYQRLKAHRGQIARRSAPSSPISFRLPIGNIRRRRRWRTASAPSIRTICGSPTSTHRAPRGRAIRRCSSTASGPPMSDANRGSQTSDAAGTRRAPTAHRDLRTSALSRRSRIGSAQRAGAQLSRLRMDRDGQSTRLRVIKRADHRARQQFIASIASVDFSTEAASSIRPPDSSSRPINYESVIQDQPATMLFKWIAAWIPDGSMRSRHHQQEIRSANQIPNDDAGRHRRPP